MTETFKLGDITIEVILRKMRHIRLSLLPPGNVARVSAPRRMNRASIHSFVVSKARWLEKQQKVFQQQLQAFSEEDETHTTVWGERCALKIVVHQGGPSVRLVQGEMILALRPEEGEAKKKLLLERFYRTALQAELPALIEKWEPVLGVKVEAFSLQKMKTRWGSCSPKKRHIRLNTELARRPPVCLEYVLVHEMVHLLEASHQPRFYQLMDRFLPTWRETKKQLNSLPIWR